MFCKHSLPSASALTNQSSRSRAALKVGCGSVAPHWIIVHFIERGACHIAPRDLAALVPRGRHRLLDMPSRPLRPCPNKILTTPRSGAGGPLAAGRKGPFRARCERFEFLPRTGFMEYWIGTAASVCFDVRRPDHLGPLLCFVGDEVAERAGTHRHRLAAELYQLRLDFQIGKRGIDLPVELVDDFGRRAFG